MNPVTLIILLQLVGFIVVVAEALLPTGGILSVVFVAIFGWSLWLAFDHSITLFFWLLALDLLVSPVVVLWGLRHSPLRLTKDLGHGGGADDSLANLVGAQGIAHTDLRPVGRARFGSTREVDVHSELGFLPCGTHLVAIRFEGNALVVRPLSTVSPKTSVPMNPPETP